MLWKNEQEEFNDPKLESSTNQHPRPSQRDLSSKVDTSKTSTNKTSTSKIVRKGESPTKSSRPELGQHKTSQTQLRPQLKLPNTMTIKLPKVNRWWRNWQFWGILLVICSGGIGYTATSLLLKLPKTQSCSTVFWPVASASVRLYCAQTLSKEKTVGSLLQAIALVEKLPDDHPLHKEINRNVEKWAQGILDIGESKFQEGNLEAAISIAQQIPNNVAAYELVESQIADWNKTWDRGAEQYEKVEANLRKFQWDEAFSWAVRLTDSKNDYWATDKYSEAIDKINLAQEETITLDKAASQLNDGDIDSLFNAINKAYDIPKTSYTFDNAQKILTEGKAKLLSKIDQLIAQQKWSQLQTATYRIPNFLGLEDQVKDWKILANAGTSASLDTVLGLEDAIAEAEKLESDSPLYEKAQGLIKRWDFEIDDVRRIATAEGLARPANISAFKKAIVEIGLIPSGNPRYQEAQTKIANWRREIRIIEDRPIIRKARELARPNDISAWRRAIAEANLISSSSPLHSEAQKLARGWRTSIETEEDQPILNQAIALAQIGDYERAIATASSIKKNRALSGEAIKNISQWRDEVNAEKFLSDAQYLARENTPESLAKAIRTVRQIAPKSALGYQVVPSVNEWSNEILNLAGRASRRSVEEGIRIAKIIPSGTAAHPEAQKLIAEWQQSLNPLPVFEKDKNKNKKKNKSTPLFEKNKKNRR